MRRGAATWSRALPIEGAPGKTDEDLASEQEAKWEAFYRVIEDWQTKASP